MSRPDFGSEADSLESSKYSLSVRVKHYRSLEYCLKWKRTMYTRRSSRLQNISKNTSKSSPCSDEEPIQRKLRGKKPRKDEKKAGHSAADTGERTGRDILDLLNETYDVKSTDDEDEGTSLAVADEKGNESDQDSVTSSICSGPSLSYHAHSKKWRQQCSCSACQKLFQKATKMNTQMKNKLLDNDPNSLTCDQWLLAKKWTPRRPYVKGNISIHIKLIKKRLKKGGRQSEQNKTEPSICSRPLVFLKRNLRRCVPVPVKKETKRRKRRRNDSQGSRIAKRKHLYSSSHPHYMHSSCPDASGLNRISRPSSSTGSENCSDQEVNNQADTQHQIPGTGSLKRNKKSEPPPKQKTQQKTIEFRDLLAQLRGNTSMIVKEKQ